MAKRRRGNGQGTLIKRGGSGAWLARWYDHEGKRRERSTRTTDKAAAQRMLSKWTTDSMLRREGVIDPHLDAVPGQAQRSIDDHLPDYEAKLNAGGRNPQYVATTVGYIRAFAKALGWTKAADITADGVNTYAKTMKERKSASRTIHAYITAIKGFTRWLVAHHKLPRDPLTSVTKPNPKVDRRIERRMLLPDEWQWLQATTLAGQERYGMAGAERVLLYATAIQTGLRAGELRSLTRGGLFLDNDLPFITCKAGSTKNRQNARQYVQPDLAGGLRELVRTKAPKTPVFALPRRDDMAAMTRADLSDARSAWLGAAKHNPDEYEWRERSDFLNNVNHEGELLDFHSLRHTCGAWLAMSGAHPKAVQAVMRHQSITLTMDTYGHLFPGQEAQTVARFAKMFDDGSCAFRATGTADPAPDNPHLQPHQCAREQARSDAPRRDEHADHSALYARDDDEHNLLRDAKKHNRARTNANKCDVNGGGRIRTYVGIIQQIYSLSRLAASVHPHGQVRSVAVR